MSSAATQETATGSYPGGKSGAGIYQRLINLIPPHRVLIVPFAGHCGVVRHIRPAEHTIVIDQNPDVCEWWDRCDAQSMVGTSRFIIAMVSSFFAIDWALPSTPTLGTETRPAATLPGASVDRLRKLRQRPMPLDSVALPSVLSTLSTLIHLT